MQTRSAPGQLSSVPATRYWARSTYTAMGISRSGTNAERIFGVPNQSTYPGCEPPDRLDRSNCRVLQRFVAEGTERTPRRKTTQETPK